MNSRFTIAVHILTVLAHKHDEPLKSDVVANSINTNPVVVRRLWSALAKAGLIVSRTGATGGGKLAREASMITLLDVYNAVEARCVFAMHANPPNKRCLIGKNIQLVLEDIFAEAQREMEKVLARKTIADVAAAIMKNCR
ncbi:MAG: Rrf2 family transcriptional regulator [Acidobacteria bacterium]|nr:Rrf2 family transcriptional regulator [Acidobacteriota bacterium]